MQTEMYDSMYRIETGHWWFRGKRDIVLSLARPLLSRSENPKLIDFGCGCGAMLAALEQYGETTGVDTSEVALSYCRTRFGGELRRMDLSAPMTPWERYDLGVALDILEHIERDDLAAANIFALLREGGCCIVTVPAFQWLWTSHDVNCMHKRRYGKKQLTELLRGAGFRVRYISYYNFRLFLPAAAVRLLSRLLHIDRDSAAENHFRDSAVNGMLYRIFSGEKKAVSRGRRFPFGLSLIALAEKPAGEAPAGV